jgi:hypothetical protein
MVAPPVEESDYGRYGFDVEIGNLARYGSLSRKWCTSTISSIHLSGLSASLSHCHGSRLRATFTPGHNFCNVHMILVKFQGVCNAKNVPNYSLVGCYGSQLE